ncbi:MAG: hypothetical protein V1728_06620 [Candidatus Micrarchaeota archaeon]
MDIGGVELSICPVCGGVKPDKNQDMGLHCRCTCNEDTDENGYD